MLFDSVTTDQRKIIRKKRGKEGRDLEDIVSLLKSIDPETVPVFVARNLERLPPLSIDHLDCTKLLKDITKLQRDIDTVKTDYATNKQLEELRIDVHKMKYASLPQSPFANVNARRGAWMDNSGPSGLSICNTNDLENKSVDSETKISPKTQLNRTHDQFKKSLQPAPFKNKDAVYDITTAQWDKTFLTISKMVLAKVVVLI